MKPTFIYEQASAGIRKISQHYSTVCQRVFASIAGSFQDGSTPGKIQFGSGWWFLDQKEGIEWQLNALSNIGLLSRFVGMITDSRSFMSYPRHEYFRRVLCNLIGRDMENGELPDDEMLIGTMIRNICYANARNYFPFAAEAGRLSAKRGTRRKAPGLPHGMDVTWQEG